MKLWQLFESNSHIQGTALVEDGKIIKNVNTTVDVQPGEIERQAEKFGNRLINGCPPTFRKSYTHNDSNQIQKGSEHYVRDGTRP